MTENSGLRSLALPAKDADTFNAYLHLSFEPIALEMMQMPVSANDVFITTFRKSGTTWMQQICHRLRSAGDMRLNLETAVDR